MDYDRLVARVAIGRSCLRPALSRYTVTQLGPLRMCISAYAKLYVTLQCHTYRHPGEPPGEAWRDDRMSKRVVQSRLETV